MKRIISIFIAIVAILALTVPAMADTAQIQTGVVVNQAGGGTAPFIKAKWESEDGGTSEPYATYESGDPTHLEAGFQILPPLAKCAVKTIRYWAVVSDDQGTLDVGNVFVIVYHPDGSPAPYNEVDPEWGEYFKYKAILTRLGHGTVETQYVNDAYDAGLITFGPNCETTEIPDDYFTLEDITGVNGEFVKEEADLWMVEEIIDYEQPAGYYTVDYYATDQANNLSNPLENQFYYEPICALEFDFTTVNYGNVNIQTPKVIAGDWDFLTANRPTVRNIGNTWAHVTVAQDDMGLGKTTSNPGTTYQGSTAPTTAQSNWNVYFDARLGSNNAYRMYYDPTTSANLLVAPNTVELPNYLALSTLEELDFSIFVRQGGGTYAGCMILGCTIEPFVDLPTAIVGEPDPCNPT